jgi:hypothetical protein
MTSVGKGSRNQSSPNRLGGPAGVVLWRRDGSAVGTELPRYELSTVRIGQADMTAEHNTPAQRKPKARRFYIISYSLAHKLADFEVENLDVLLMGDLSLDPPAGKRGFPTYPEKPRVAIGKRKSGPPPSDIELYHSYWLVSDRLKSVFESVDRSAFAFQACDVTLRDGSPGPIYWLCDVVRVLEAFGPKTLEGIRLYQERTGFRYRGFIDDKNLSFDEQAIGEHHVFRTPYSLDDVFCDQVMVDACKNGGIKGVKFHKSFGKLKSESD